MIPSRIWKRRVKDQPESVQQIRFSNRVLADDDSVLPELDIYLAKVPKVLDHYPLNAHSMNPLRESYNQKLWMTV